MDIVYATSDLYSKPAMISIKSLLVNNLGAECINIYYIENGLSDENKELLLQLVHQYNRNIYFIPMPEKLNEIGGLMRTNPIVYSYCYFQDILPCTVNRVLLLEGDATVTADIQEYFELDIDPYYLAAADDFQSKWYKKLLRMNGKSVYFNSGIMLFNLKKWRENGITEKITQIIKKGKSKFFYEVQDELNVLFEGKILVLPPRFNATTSIFLFDYKNMLRYRWPSTRCSKEEFEQARNTPLIVHFTKNQIIQSRPWIEDCVHPYNDYYVNLKLDTFLKQEPLWKEKRGRISKWAYRIYQTPLRSLMAFGLGFVHSFFYPVIMYVKNKFSDSCC